MTISAGVDECWPRSTPVTESGSTYSRTMLPMSLLFEYFPRGKLDFGDWTKIVRLSGLSWRTAGHLIVEWGPRTLSGLTSW